MLHGLVHFLPQGDNVVKNGIIRIQVCVFCLDEDNFSFCDKCSKVVCLTDDFFDSRSCMDLCEGCDKWFCNKCQKDQGFEFCMHCGEKRFQSTDGCLVRMGTFTKPMCASNILLSFSPLTSFLRCGARQETNISVRIASKHARCAMRMSARDACVTGGSLAMRLSVPLWQRPITDFFKTTHAKTAVDSIKSVSARLFRQKLITDFLPRMTAFVSVPVPYYG